MVSRIRIITAVLLLFVLSWYSTAAPASAPIQYQIYCLRNSTDCKPAKPTELTTDKQLEILKAVNSRVNSHVTYRPDSPAGSDSWNRAVFVGDCEDFALAKRYEAIKAGLPAGALRMATATVNGEGHAVLLAYTARGTYVLDNRYSNVMRMSAVPYHWLQHATADPLQWVRD